MLPTLFFVDKHSWKDGFYCPFSKNASHFWNTKSYLCHVCDAKKRFKNIGSLRQHCVSVFHRMINPMKEKDVNNLLRGIAFDSNCRKQLQQYYTEGESNNLILLWWIDLSMREFKYDFDKFIGMKEADNKRAREKECLIEKRFWYPQTNNLLGFSQEKVKVFHKSINR